MKACALSDNCYYNTYLKKHKIEYNTLAGNHISEKSLRQCILIFMVDNLVRLTFFADPGPDVKKSKQICTLPMSLKGIPMDDIQIEEWHDQQLCDGTLLCPCKDGNRLKQEDVTDGFLRLKPNEQDTLDRFKSLITWGYNDLWSYIVSSESWVLALDEMERKDVNEATDLAMLEQSFASVALSDDENDTEQPAEAKTVDLLEEESELAENVDIGGLLAQIDQDDVLQLDSELAHFEHLFPPLDASMDSPMNVQNNCSAHYETSSDTALIKQCMEITLGVMEPYPETHVSSVLSVGSETCLDLSSISPHNSYVKETDNFPSTAISPQKFTELQPVTLSTIQNPENLNPLQIVSPNLAFHYQRATELQPISPITEPNGSSTSLSSFSDLRREITYSVEMPFPSQGFLQSEVVLDKQATLYNNDRQGGQLPNVSQSFDMPTSDKSMSNYNNARDTLSLCQKKSSRRLIEKFDCTNDRLSEYHERNSATKFSSTSLVHEETNISPVTNLNSLGYQCEDKKNNPVNLSAEINPEDYMVMEDLEGDAEGLSTSQVSSDNASEKNRLHLPSAILDDPTGYEHKLVSTADNPQNKTDDLSCPSTSSASTKMHESSSLEGSVKFPSRIKEATQILGFVKFQPPKSITRHPPPTTGRDDNIMKLRDILDDILQKTDHLDPDDKIANKILFAPDQKIGQNLLKLLEEKDRYQVFLPEFPCLHLRKSKIANLCTAYKDAGLIHILSYMRDDDTQEWSKLISADDINKATGYIRRLSLAFHVAFLSKFLTTLQGQERTAAVQELIQGSITDVINKYHDKYSSFLKDGISRNATFALHFDLMQHCDEISAIAFAERLGGQDGYDLLLGSVKSSLPFAFMNGAVSYAPYCTQLLRIHYESGYFYQRMKAALFSTPHKTSNYNFALDCQREMDHKDVIKAFRSGSSESAVVPRMALIDTFTEIQDSPLRNPKKENNRDNEASEDFLGLELNEMDKLYILRVASLIIRQGGLSTNISTIPVNVYGRNQGELPDTILDKTTCEIGSYLIQKYLATTKLCGMTKCSLPDVNTLEGPKEYINRVKSAKGHTVKRLTKAMTKSKAMTEREVREEQRQKVVAKQRKTYECMSSDMNTCQAVVKPDCSKPKVQKSTGIPKALHDIISVCKTADTDIDVRSADSLISVKASNLPVKCVQAKLATVEFAGVKFKAKVVSGRGYIAFIQNVILNKILKMLPSLNHLIICEEKYGFTPDDFKAATRRQRTEKDKFTISHLKTKQEMLAADKFDRKSLVTTQEGKCLISTHLARNVSALQIKRDMVLDIDSELHAEGCECESACGCLKYTTPIRCTFSATKGFTNMEKLCDIKQRKGEAELSQIDWLVRQVEEIEAGEPCVSIVTSGDIDSVVLHIFAISHLWPRDSNGLFRNPVYVVLQKPHSQTDIYDITGLVELLEKFYGERFIGLKLSVGLSLGGNDYVPKFHGISHTKTASLLLSSVKFREKLVVVHTNENDEFLRIEFDSNVYLEFVKHLYCLESWDPEVFSFEEVRQLSIQPLKLAGSDAVRDAQCWMPPEEALLKLGQNVKCLINYYMTAGCHEAQLPNFLNEGCLKRLESGDIEYDLGKDTRVEDARLLLSFSPKDLRDKIASSKKRKSRIRKRKIKETPQKGERRKLKTPLLTSTPTK